MYHSTSNNSYSTVFDSIDDLAAVKGYTIKTRKNEKGGDIQEIDINSMPFLTGEPDATNFWDMGKVQGFIFGCLKASALKHDEHESHLADLLKRIEALENQKPSKK